MSTTQEQHITFITEDGLTLAGILRVPAAATAAIAFTGPFTGVKEQVTGAYAEGLAAAGFATLAFDHRNFGESAGTPRQHEDAAGKLADLRAAVGRLSALGFDRIGLTGVCLGGGYALKAAAQDPRVGAVACVAGAYPGAPGGFAGRGEEYRQVLRSIMDDAWTAAGGLAYQPAVSADGGRAAMPGDEPYAYYGTARSFSPHWANRVTVASAYQTMTIDTMAAADLISPTPLLVVHGTTDGYCSPDAAREVYERAAGPKRIVWLPTTNHIDLYDVPEYVTPALAELAGFFGEALTATAGTAAARAARG